MFVPVAVTVGDGDRRVSVYPTEVAVIAATATTGTSEIDTSRSKSYPPY